MAHHVANEKDQMAVHHKWESSTRQPNTSPESIPIDKYILQGCEQYCQHLKGLGEFKPEEGHANEEGLIEEVEEGESMTPHDPEECTEKVEEARKVEGIGPKENPPRRTRAQREAKEPLECCGQVGVVPEPTGLTNLSSSRQNGADEYCSRDEKDEETMEHRQRTKGDLAALGEEESKGEVEEERK
ncbi:hypothetical protein Ancab_000801 [Ancistrocladus abbreviatus]